MKVTKLFQFTTLFTMFILAHAATANASDYKVSMRVIENGEEILTPLMLVKEGADASISLAGDQSVTVGIVVTEQEADKFHLLAEVETSSNVISPELLVRQGEWASVEIDELEFHVMVEPHAAN